MQELSFDELLVVSGGDQVPATSTGSGTYYCPSGYYPAKVNGQIVCVKPH
jgi:hypothetical protein